ncbi:MAG: hypothetical protein AB1696_23170 [Planctomycetota bacterium]
MGKTKILTLVAFVSVITFAGALYRYTQEVDKRITQAEQQKAQPTENLKLLEDKLKGVEASVNALTPLKSLATQKTADALMNLAIAGAAAKGASGDVSKLLAEQVQLQMDGALKKLKAELAAEKGGGPETEKLAKDLQAVKDQLAKLDSGGGAKADQAMQRAAAAEAKIGDLAKQVAAAGKAAEASEAKALAQDAASKSDKIKAEVAALGAKVAAMEQSAGAAKRPQIIVQPGVLDTSKGNDIKQALRTMQGFRDKFETIYSVNLSSGEITVKPGYHVAYFVSPADLVIPKSSVWLYRRVVCEVNENGIVNCTVMFTRGDSARSSDEKGVVNFMIIAHRVD